MTTLWRKAIRDFWTERARTALVVLAIALGISAFASVLSSYAILTRELDRGYLETNPASAVLRVDRIDDGLVAEILQNPEISDAEPRRTVTGQIKAGPVQWRNLTLFVVKDYGDIRVSKLEPEAGAWPPATGEILIERDAFQVVRANIGDQVKVKTANGKEQLLLVSGGVHDVGQAQARMENIVYGYINLATLVQLGEEPYLDQLNILVSNNRLDQSHIEQVASDVKTLIESRGRQIRSVNIPAPGKHPHSDLTGILLLAMSSFGLFVLLLSGILVVNLLTALMASQVRQIGVMKAIGGTRWQIARIRSEEHTSELQSRLHLVCRLLLEKKNMQRLRVQLIVDAGRPAEIRTLEADRARRVVHDLLHFREKPVRVLVTHHAAVESVARPLR